MYLVIVVALLVAGWAGLRAKKVGKPPLLWAATGALIVYFLQAYLTAIGVGVMGAAHGLALTAITAVAGGGWALLLMKGMILTAQPGKAVEAPPHPDVPVGPGQSAPMPSKSSRTDVWSMLRTPIHLFAGIAGMGLLAMVLVTSADVILRAFRISITGAYDITCIAGTLTIAAALPYTTAIKGHVAIEYFFNKLGRRGRIGVDTLMRLLDITLFSLLAWFSVQHGLSLKRSGQVSMTLQLPVYWVLFVIALSCGLVVVVTLYHMLHPGKEMIKP